MPLHMYAQSELPYWFEEDDSRFVIGMRSVTYVHDDNMDGVMLSSQGGQAPMGAYGNRAWEEPFGEVFSSRRMNA